MPVLLPSGSYFARHPFFEFIDAGIQKPSQALGRAEIQIGLAAQGIAHDIDCAKDLGILPCAPVVSAVPAKHKESVEIVRGAAAVCGTVH